MENSTDKSKSKIRPLGGIRPKDGTPETSALRPQITADDLNAAILDVQRKLRDRVNEKGTGAFVSRHEILGALTEEYNELIDAVHRGSIGDVERELADLAVGALFGIACVSAKKVQW